MDSFVIRILKSKKFTKLLIIFGNFDYIINMTYNIYIKFDSGVMLWV